MLTSVSWFSFTYFPYLSITDLSPPPHLSLLVPHSLSLPPLSSTPSLPIYCDSLHLPSPPSTSSHSLHLLSLPSTSSHSLHLLSLTPPPLTSFHLLSLPPPPSTSLHLPSPPLTSLPLLIFQVPPVKWLFRSDLNQTNTAILCPVQDLFSGVSCGQQGTHRQTDREQDTTQ